MSKLLKIFAFSFLVVTEVSAQTPLTKLKVVVDGEVKTLVVDEPTQQVYFGGDFTKVGARHPNWVIVDKASKQPLNNLPEINGPVITSFPDGSGGYYIGGGFSQVGESLRNGLAHLNSTGQLTSWASDLNLNGGVSAIYKSGSKVFVGGSFTGSTISTSGIVYDLNSKQTPPSFPVIDGAISQVIPDGAGGWYLGGSFINVGGLPRRNLAHINAAMQVDDFFKDQLLDAQVNALALDGSTLYVGGDFTKLNPIENSGLIVESDGSILSSFPKISGSVFTSESDGNGGWLIGGNFTKVGDLNRNNFARINSDGTVHSMIVNFDGTISDIKRDGNTIYVAGYFSKVNAIQRSYLVAIDLTTGSLIDWTPNPNGPVSRIAVHTSQVIATGEFTEIGEQERYLIGSIDKLNGSATSLNFSLSWDGRVNSLELLGNVLYLAGEFQDVLGQVRNNVAAIDLQTQALLAWSPQINHTVNKILFDDGKIYLGGYFSTVQGESRKGVASVDAITGILTNWNADVDGTINTLAIRGSSVFLAGQISNVGGQQRQNLAEVSKIDGSVTDLNFSPNGEVTTISSSGAKLLIGGGFTQIGGTVRRRLAAFDKTTGILSDWNPDANLTVATMTISGPSLYIGGSFSSIGGVERNHLASISLASGLVTSWNPSANSSVSTIAIAGMTAYVGGYFSTVGGANRNYLAAIDLTSGVASSWNPNPDNIVNAILPKGSSVYVGGNFNQINGLDHQFLAEIDINGVSTSWSPVIQYPDPPATILDNGTSIFVGWYNYLSEIDLISGATLWGIQPSNGAVTTLAKQGTNFFAGGSFTSIPNIVSNLFVLDGVTGEPDLTYPKPNNSVTDFASSGSTLFLNGVFSLVNGESRSKIAAINSTTGQLLSWNANLSSDSEIYSIAIEPSAPSILYVGGNFTSIGGQARQNLAALSTTTALASSWDPASVDPIHSLVAANNKVIIAGDFGFTSVDASGNYAGISSGLEGGLVQSLAVDNDILYIIGQFSQIDIIDRKNIASFDLSTGNLTNWDAGLNGYVNSISFSGSTFLIGGSFTGYDLQTRNHLASLSSVDGSLTSWNPNANGVVNKLAISGTSIFAGGSFSQVGGSPRNSLASISLIDGTVNSWNPGANGEVFEVKFHSGSIYVGGSFTQLGGFGRPYIGSIDAVSGAISAWSPSPDERVRTISIYNGAAYIGGFFNQVNGDARKKLASINISNNSLLTWNPLGSIGIPSNTETLFLNVNNDKIYLSNNYGFGLGDIVSPSLSKIVFTNFSGSMPVNAIGFMPGFFIPVGGFTRIGEDREGIAIFSDTDNDLQPWSTQVDGDINTISVLSDKIFVGGSFTSVSNSPQQGIAIITSPFQSLQFDPIPRKTLADAPFGLTAQSGTNVPITFSSSNPAVATINGSEVTITGIGETIITANQAGNSLYFPSQIERVLSVIELEPSTPTGLQISSLSTTSLSIEWQHNGTLPSGYLVLSKSGSVASGIPQDAQSYMVDDLIGDSKVVYKGQNNSFVLSALTPGTNYFFSIYAYNGTGNATNYSSTALSGNQFTLPLAPVLNTSSTVDQSSITISWSAVFGAAGYTLDISSDNFLSYVSGFQNKSLGNVLTYKAEGLTGDTQFKFRIRAVNNGGSSVDSNVESALTKPAPPVLNAPTGLTSTGFTMSWNNPGGNNYFIDISTDNFVSFLPSFNNLSVGALTIYTITGLSPSSTYQYRIRAQNTSGSSLDSNTINVVMLALEPISQPTSLIFSNVSATALTGAFTNASGSPTGYIVIYKSGASPTDEPVDGTEYVAGGLIGSSTIAYVGSSNTFSLTSLNPNTVYFFDVFSYNGSSGTYNYLTSSPLKESRSTLTSEPTSQPTNLLFPSVTISSQDVSFIAALGSPTGYLVLRKSGSTPTETPTDGTEYTLGSSVGTSTVAYVGANTTFANTGLAAGTNYFYAVYAFNGSTNTYNYLATSPLEGSRSTLVVQPSNQPTSLQFTAVSTTSFSGSFIAATGSPAGYVVLYKTTSSPTDVPIDGLEYAAGNTIGTSNVAYVGALTSFSLTGLTANTFYFFDIFSFEGSTLTYNYLTTTPLEGNQTTLAVAPANQTTLVSASDITTTSAVISFTSAGSAGYLVLRYQGAEPNTPPANATPYVAGSSLGSSIVVYTGSNLSFTDAGLSSGTSYSYAVYSFNGSGGSIHYLTTFSAANSISIISLPNFPVAKAASNTSALSFTANWDAVTGAVSYEVDVSKDDFATLQSGFPKTGINNTELIVEGLTPQTIYKYRVRAINASGGKSANSNAITATTSENIGPVLKINTLPKASDFIPGKNLIVDVSGGTGSKTVVLWHRSILSSAFLSKNASLKSGSDYEVEVTELMLDVLGLEYYFEATDQAGGFDKQSASSYLYRTLSATTGTVIPFAPGFNGKEKTYQMFSVPYDLGVNDINNLFDRVLEGKAGKDWRMFHYADGKYKEYPDDIDEIETGKGYWFNTRKKDGDDNKQFKIGDGSVVKRNQNEPFEMVLQSGWNQIGNPYPFDINWSQVTAGSEIGPLYIPVGKGYDNTSNILKPWKGAFVFNSSQATIELPIKLSAKTNGRVAQREMLQPTPDAEEWLLNLSATVGDQSQNSGIGMHPLASSSKDKYDEIVVPRFFDYVEMNTNHPEFFAPRFSTDVVPSANEYVWLFDVQSNLDKERGEVTWDNLAIQHMESSLLLIDLSEHRWVDMKTTNRYSFTHKEGKQLKIVYNRKGEWHPGVTMLGDAYPNPFIAQVNIPVLTDNDNSQLYLVVYDLMGKRVKRISKNFAKDGLNAFEWDGLDEQGNPVSAGLLIYRLESSNGNVLQSKRMIKY